MYIIENKLDTPQDLVNHLTKTFKAQATISDVSYNIFVVCHSEVVETLTCFADSTMFNKCCDDLIKCMDIASNEGSCSELCWAGLRLIIRKVVIGDNIYYVSVDKFMLDTDSQVLNEEEISKEVKDKVILEHFHSIFYGVPVLTNTEVNKMLDIMEQCLKEFYELGNL